MSYSKILIIYVVDVMFIYIEIRSVASFRVVK